MKNYTTQTAALKATTIDTKILDAKQIDTKKLFISGELFDPSQIKESPNEAIFNLVISPSVDGDVYTNGIYILMFENQPIQIGSLQKGSQTEGALSNGVYARIQIDDDFTKCIGLTGLNDNGAGWVYNIPFAKFEIVSIGAEQVMRFESCILDNFITDDNESLYWIIKICEEDDNFSELYGGLTEEMPSFFFSISIPYYNSENDTSSSTYSLRKTNPIDSLREIIEQIKQQNLDNSTE